MAAMMRFDKRTINTHLLVKNNHLNTVERRLSGLLGTWLRPDKRITRIMSQIIYFITNSWLFFGIFSYFLIK